MLVIHYSYLSPPLSISGYSRGPFSPSLPLFKDNKGDSASDSWAYYADSSIIGSKLEKWERKVYTERRKLTNERRNKRMQDSLEKDKGVGLLGFDFRKALRRLAGKQPSRSCHCPGRHPKV